MTDDLPETKLQLTRQAEEIIDADITSVDLVAQLDVGRYAHEDPHRDKGGAEPFEPMFRARLLQELEDYYDPELRRELEDPNVARALGFDPDDLPHRSTFTRARTDRFAELDSRIETTCRQMREVAWDRGSSIGPELEPEDTSGTSKRTRERLIRGKMKEIAEEMAKLAFPAFNLPRPDDAVYDEEELLEMETVMGLVQLAAEQGGETYGDFLDREAELGEDDPFFEDGPTGETLLGDVKQLLAEEIAEMVNRALGRIFPRIRRYEEFLEPILLALDITYIGISVDGRGIPHVSGAPKHKRDEFDWCFKFATANIVGENAKFPVAVFPVGEAGNLDHEAYPGEDKTFRPGNVMRNLLDAATDHVNVRCVLADREFYAADSIAALTERDLRYVIPIPANERIERFQTGVDEVTVEHGYTFHGTVKHRVTNEPVVTTLVAMPPDESYDIVQVFATNLSVDDEINLDRRRTKRKINRYRNRAAVETSYKKIKKFGAWTTTMNVSVRFLHFGFAVILYSLWLLFDFLTKVSLDELDYRDSPMLKAARFREMFKDRFKELL